MKVGVFCDNIASAQGGGYTFTTEILQAVSELAPQSPHQIIVLSTHSGKIETLPAAERLSYVSTQATGRERLRYKLSFLRTAVKETLKHPRNLSRVKTWNVQFIEDLLRTHQIDLLWHVSSHCCLSMTVPYIMTVWDLAHRTQPYFPEVSNGGQWEGREHGWKAQEPGYSTTLRRAAYILTGTEVGKAEIKQFYQVPAEKIRILPFPVPRITLEVTQESELQALANYGLEPGYLFYPAQFWPHKNHVNLLLALQILRDRDQIVLTVAFSGSDMGNLSRIEALAAELGLASQVKFLGFVPQAHLVALYRHAFALTFVSFFGPDNLPPLEAFSLGCPVIAAKVPGALEQLGDAALLADPQDPAHVADMIKQLWDDPVHRETLIERGLLRADRRSRQDYVRDVFDLLNEFAAVRRCW
jgi:glycosyltransferase involved in cell wall biosynthesis